MNRQVSKVYFYLFSTNSSLVQNVSLTYYLQNDYRKALENYTQALELRRALGDRYGEAIMLNSIAGVYSSLGEKQKAIEYYNQSLTLFRAEKKSPEIASTLISLGGVYASLGDTAYNKRRATVW